MSRQATVKPPIPPASLPPGIPWRRLIGASLADAMRQVMKAVFLQIEQEGFPDARTLGFQVDPREQRGPEAAPLILPEEAWSVWAQRGQREPLSFVLHGAHQHEGEVVEANYRALRCTPEGLEAQFSFSDDPAAPEWRPVAIPWACLVEMRDGWAGVTLVVQDRAVWDRDEPAVAGSEEAEAQEDVRRARAAGLHLGLVDQLRELGELRRAQELRRAEAAFRTMPETDPKKAH